MGSQFPTSIDQLEKENGELSMAPTYEDAADIETQIRINTEQRTPCVLVLDVSYSMDGERIESLNRGLVEFETALKNDEMALDRVVVQVITFGGSVEIYTNWTDASEFSAPSLSPSGDTPMGTAMELALDEIDRLKETFREGGITWTRPWIFLMTDGGPTDDSWRESAARVRDAVQQKRAIVWPIAMPDADFGPLREFGGDTADIYSVDTANFGSLFKWLSASLSQVAQSRVGETIQLAAPPGPVVEV